MPGTSCIHQAMPRCGKSGSRCHPRSRLGFTDDASTDISCNIMPPPAPPPPHHLSATQRTCRHKIPLVFCFFFSKNDNIYFPNGPKECLQAVLWPTLWVQLKRNVGIVYTNGLNECVAARENSQSECSVMRAFLHSAVKWKKTLRHETELAFNTTNVDPASWVGAKKWLIYTRHIYFPNNLCKQLCSDTELCLKRAQVNGPSLSVMVDKQLISKLGLWRHSGDQVAPSMMDRARKISSSPAPVTWSQSGDQELCLQTLFQFTRAVKLGISGARRNDENKGPMSSFCVYCQSTCL